MTPLTEQDKIDIVRELRPIIRASAFVLFADEGRLELAPADAIDERERLPWATAIDIVRAGSLARKPMQVETARGMWRVERRA